MVWTCEPVHSSAGDMLSPCMRMGIGEGELGRGRIRLSGLVGGKEQGHAIIGQVRLWSSACDMVCSEDRPLLAEPLWHRIAALWRLTHSSECSAC